MLFSLVGIKRNLALLEICFLCSRGLNQMEEKHLDIVVVTSFGSLESHPPPTVGAACRGWAFLRQVDVTMELRDTVQQLFDMTTKKETPTMKHHPP